MGTLKRTRKHTRKIRRCQLIVIDVSRPKVHISRGLQMTSYSSVDSSKRACCLSIIRIMGSPDFLGASHHMIAFPAIAVLSPCGNAPCADLHSNPSLKMNSNASYAPMSQ